MQQMLLGVGAVAKSTYVDDVFNTNVYTGTSSSTGSGTTQAINTGFNLASEGGLIWNKGRSFSDNHFLIDTVRGANKLLKSNQDAAESTYSLVNAFTSTGYTTTDDVGINGTGKTYASWTFRKAPGFFDVVTYTGNGSARTIAHSLGSVPGMILIKKTSASDPWSVYHRSLDSSSPENYRIFLDESDARVAANTSIWNQTKPTSTHFSLGTNDQLNGNGATYVAYLFAGGESTAATARSVEFDSSSSEALYTGASNDFHLTGDFTIEGWFYSTVQANFKTLWGIGNRLTDNGVRFYYGSDGIMKVSHATSGGTAVLISTSKIPIKQWAHIALVRSGNTVTMYLNGTKEASQTDTSDFGSSTNKDILIGTARDDGATNFLTFYDGKISNFRVVKGTAVYTSSFRPPTEPLTNITNTKLLCCNNSSITGSTVTPSTISSNGTPVASTDSPFDDPAGFAFGDAGDQNVIKCGSYVGNGSATGPEIFLGNGWEPQWLLIKNADGGSNWRIVDSMRGIATGGNDAFLTPDLNEAEFSSNKIDLTPTGFKITAGNGDVNENNDKIIYVAIRRPDGYVGKPPELGTGVFAMDVGSNNFPAFDSNFPVDFVLQKAPDAAANWLVPSRLTGSAKYLKTNTTDAEASWDVFDFDSNVGWGKASTWAGATNNAWMFKRHAGFDVVTYKGDGQAGRQIPHSLNKTIEMMWVKNREGSDDPWKVYHKGLDGGTNPEEHNIELSGSYAEGDSTVFWNDTAPTATHFTVGTSDAVNEGSKQMLAILFASVDGISKVGSYTGNGTGASSTQTITLGFQPRFLIVKKADGTNHWAVFDTTRGWGSGTNDAVLELNENGAQSTGFGDVTEPTSTGFIVRNNYGMINTNNSNYIYYAHA